MASRIRTILVATSLEEASDDALRAALELRAETGADLHLVHAFHPARLGWAAAQPEIVDSERRSRLEGIVEQLRRLGSRPGEVSESRVEMGAPHRVLLAIAAELAPDLIVAGATESTGRLAQMLGSTTDRILRKATCPVLVVRGPMPMPPPRVLAPVDLSDLSEESLKRGLGMLLQIRKPRHPPVEALFVLGAGEMAGRAQSAEELDRLAGEELDRFIGRLHRITGAPIEASLMAGQPKEKILEKLDSRAYDLVIMGTHGGSGFERLLVGGVTAGVVRKAPCSALVIPPIAAKIGTEEKQGSGRVHLKSLRFSDAFGRSPLPDATTS